MSDHFINMAVIQKYIFQLTDVYFPMSGGGGGGTA